MAGIFRRDSIDERAPRGVCRDDGAPPAGEGRHRCRAPIESQSRLLLGRVGAMASVAVLGEDRADVPIEVGQILGVTALQGRGEEEGGEESGQSWRHG